MAYPPDSGDLTTLRTFPQSSDLYIAGLEMPTVVFAARVNQTFSTHDMQGEVTYDTVTSGVSANVRPGHTLWIGSVAGAYDVGQVRVRKAATSTKLFFGEESDVALADNQFLTVVDEMLPWTKHVKMSGETILYDYENAYTDQNELFEPIPIMGPPIVLDVSSYPATITFPEATKSSVFGSTISAWAWSSSEGSWSGSTTSNPTLTVSSYPSNGRIRIAVILTAANGKSSIGYRYAYIYDSTHRPIKALKLVDGLEVDTDSGGWSCSLSARADVNLTAIRDRCPVIIFAKEYYGSTQTSLGPLASRNNIKFVGYVVGETIDWDPTSSRVEFEVQGAHHWLAESGAFPIGLRFRDADVFWTDMPQMTVDRALWHLLHFRSTATAITDVAFTGDTKFTLKAYSNADTLWDQLKEIAGFQLLARPGVDRFGRIFIEVEPQVVPTASRTWTTVMTLTKKDYRAIKFTRRPLLSVSQVDLSGVNINSSGGASAFFSLAPGRVMARFGKPMVVDRLLLSDQSQSNTLASLVYDWKNQRLLLDVDMPQNNAYLDCFPRQRYQIAIAAGDTARGIAYSGYIVPRRVQMNYDEDAQAFRMRATFEIETVEGLSTNGDIPGSSDDGYGDPPRISLPDIPDIPITIPGTTTPSADGPRRLLLHDASKGLLYTSEFYKGLSAQWRAINAGLSVSQYPSIDKVVPTPGGGLLVARRGRTGQVTPFIAYAPSPGATFTVIEDVASIIAKLTHSAFVGVNAIGVDPLTGRMAYVISANDGFGTTVSSMYIGTGTSFAEAAVNLDGLINVTSRGSLTYGFGNWRLTGSLNNTHPRLWVISSDGSTLVRNVVTTETNGATYHIPISSTDELYMMRSDGLLHITDNGANAAEFTTVLGSLLNEPVPWDNYFACDPTGYFIMGDWDAGRRGKSSDQSATWSGMGSLPAAGPYALDYAGGSRWIAASSVLYSSNDFGVTWVNRGNNSLLALAPLMNANIVKVLEY